MSHENPLLMVLFAAFSGLVIGIGIGFWATYPPPKPEPEPLCFWADTRCQDRLLINDDGLVIDPEQFHPIDEHGLENRLNKMDRMIDELKAQIERLKDGEAE